MTDDEKKKMLAGFQKQVQDDQPAERWTQDEILNAAKRIMKRLGIEGDLSDPFEGVNNEHF